MSPRNRCPPSLRVVVANPDAATLRWLSAELYGRLRPLPLGPNPRARSGEWVVVAGAFGDRSVLDPLVDARSGPLGASGSPGDRELVVAQVVREATSVLAHAAVALWARQRRLFDWSAANVAMTAGPVGVDVGLLDASLTVGSGDPLAGAPGVGLAGDEELFDRLLRIGLGEPVASGELPAGPPGDASAVATVIAAGRRRVRSGDRHLWGNVALAVANALIRPGPAVDVDADRAALFGARPDLVRTIELCTVATHGGPVTFPIRRTCCLLYKLPPGLKCTTCSLADRDQQVADLAAWYSRPR